MKYRTSFIPDTDGDPTCSFNSPLIGNSNDVFGCFEKIPNNTVFQDFSGFSNPNFTIQHSIDFKEKNWRLHSFTIVNPPSINTPTTITLYENIIDFPLTSLSLTINLYVGQPYELKCSRCDSLLISYNQSNETIELTEGKVVFIPKENIATLYAICQQKVSTFCNNSISVPNSSVVLFTYPLSDEKQDGIYEIENSDNGPRLISGVQKQFISERSLISYYKTWEGEIVRSSELEPSQIIVKYELEASADSGNQSSNKVLISAEFGNLQIPFNYHLLQQNVDLFLQLLYLTNQNSMTNDSFINFNHDGTVSVHSTLIFFPFCKN